MTRTGRHSIGGRAAALAAALVVSAFTAAWSQMAIDPLTGATPDPAAALGAKPYEAVYFDSKGNVTDDSSKAVKYSITDNIQGFSTIPKSMEQMSPQEREQLGLATPPGDAKEKDDKPAPKADDAKKPAAAARAPAPAAARETEDGNPDHVPGSEETDPNTGIVYGTIKPQLVEAAKDSYGTKDGADVPTAVAAASGEPSASGLGGSAYAYVAPAVAAQVRVLEGPGAAAGGFRALNALVSLRNTLLQGIQRYLGDDSTASLAGAGSAYDGAAHRSAADDNTRASDARFGIPQQELR